MFIFGFWAKFAIGPIKKLNMLLVYGGIIEYGDAKSTGDNPRGR